MSVGYSLLAIYAPLFLQRLHGVSLLGAGYMVTLSTWGAGAKRTAAIGAGPEIVAAG
jgi:hypothetical protein